MKAAAAGAGAHVVAGGCARHLTARATRRPRGAHGQHVGTLRRHERMAAAAAPHIRSSRPRPPRGCCLARGRGVARTGTRVQVARVTLVARAAARERTCAGRPHGRGADVRCFPRATAQLPREAPGGHERARRERARPRHLRAAGPQQRGLRLRVALGAPILTASEQLTAPRQGEGAFAPPASARGSTAAAQSATPARAAPVEPESGAPALQRPTWRRRWRAWPPRAPPRGRRSSRRSASPRFSDSSPWAAYGGTCRRPSPRQVPVRERTRRAAAPCLGRSIVRSGVQGRAFEPPLGARR